jgi:peptidoglycan-associated lipoprotein
MIALRARSGFEQTVHEDVGNKSYSEEMTVMMWRFRTTAVLMLVAALTVSACGKKKVATPPPQPAPPPAATPTTPPPPTPAPPPPAPPAEKPPSEADLFAKMTLDELNKSGVMKHAYFAYDSIELSEEARANLQKDADYLKKWSSTKVLIEGHADSRGTNEYNLALGERRADAVRDYIVSLGIPTDRVTIVSKGEEQPFCKEETEACWQQNRVGYFIFTAK